MIDISQYTPKKRRFLKVMDRACVYIACPAEKKPVKVGRAADIYARLVGIQTGNWQELFVFEVLWFPGPPVAARIENTFHDRNSARQLVGEWFDVDAEEALELLKNLSQELYPSVECRDHATTIAKLKAKVLDRRDWQEAT